jgi:putative SOS response-associated peptidase YedK
VAAGPSDAADRITDARGVAGRASLPAFAGLWEHWKGPEGPVESCTIIVTVANAFMGKLHHRMPVILDPATISTAG